MRRMLFILVFAVAVQAETADERAIRNAALDYAEGWYAGDGDRMARAVHPDLAKRIANANNVEHMTAEQLIGATRRGSGTKTPVDKQLKDVKILDVFGNAATVRLEMQGWIDYLHVARVGTEWKIVNVLWERKK